MNFATSMNNKQYARKVNGIINYAKADKSDPFALARGFAHLRSGALNPLSNGEESIYSATPYEEKRTLPDGREYYVEGWKNVTRP